MRRCAHLPVEGVLAAAHKAGRARHVRPLGVGAAAVARAVGGATCARPQAAGFERGRVYESKRSAPGAPAPAVPGRRSAAVCLRVLCMHVECTRAGGHGSQALATKPHTTEAATSHGRVAAGRQGPGRRWRPGMPAAGRWRLLGNSAWRGLTALLELGRGLLARGVRGLGLGHAAHHREVEAQGQCQEPHGAWCWSLLVEVRAAAPCGAPAGGQRGGRGAGGGAGGGIVKQATARVARLKARSCSGLHL